MRQIFLRKIYSGRLASQILTTLVIALICSDGLAADITSRADTSPAAPVTYELVGISRFDGISYASIIEVQTGYHFLLSTIDRSQHGLLLASVRTYDDPSGPAATIQTNGVSLTLELGSSASTDPDATAPAALPAPISASPVTAPGAPAQTYYPTPPSGAPLPLVFMEVDPQKMTLSADQKATLGQLRQDFINDLNGATPANTPSIDATSPIAAGPAAANQNSASSDTQYQDWLAAQKKSDATFRMIFGTQAFNAYTESSSYPTWH